jgi:hypothetical protein
MVQNAGTLLGLPILTRFLPKHHDYAYAHGSTTTSLTTLTELAVITPILSTGYGIV